MQNPFSLSFGKEPISFIERGKQSLEIMDNFMEDSQYLEEYVYEKIWSELSLQDKEVLRAMNEATSHKVEAIREKAGKSSGNFSV